MSDAESKVTPLYEEHRRLGAKIIPFGGWLMPVQYTSISDEHQAVRNNVGVFDISHMGQLTASGASAGAWLNRMLTNNIDKLEVGTGQYTFLLNERGGIIDDLIVYRTAPNEFLLVVNASRTDEDFAWLQKHIGSDVGLTRLPDRAGLAVQGPKVVALFQKLLGADKTLPARNEIREFDYDGVKLTIARTGYTGEDGVEVFFDAKDAAKIWNALLQTGDSLGIKPCGLGARDTLRLEMCYPLNGSDLTPETSPIEAGLGFFVDLTKPDFIGRDVLKQQKENGTTRKLVPFKMKGKGPPPRPHYPVWQGGREDRRSEQRHTVTEFERRHRHDLRPNRPGENRRRTRDRNSWTKISCCHRKETTLQETIMSNVPDDLRYTESHEWVRVEGDKARVGITDHAQAELTDVVYVELPKVGTQVEARGQIAVVESVKAASDIYAPIKGEVVEVNEALSSNPALVNTDPFGEGWIFVLKMANADDVKQLKDAAAYKQAIG